MRAFVAVGLFALAVAVVGVSQPGTTAAQDKKAKQPKKADPKTFKPDAATLKTITDKTEQLRHAVAALKAKKIPLDVLSEVEIYLKAAENIVRFEEWLHSNSVKWTLATLDQGLARVKQAEGGKAVWRDTPGKWVFARVPLTHRQLDSTLRSVAAARLRQRPAKEVAARHRPTRPRRIADRGKVHRHAQRHRAERPGLRATGGIRPAATTPTAGPVKRMSSRRGMISSIRAATMNALMTIGLFYAASQWAARAPGTSAFAIQKGFA